MGKKTKLGKFRKDKFYKLAKETGFRSRAAFKLIQLNRKFGFLQESQVCIDLCAAPGGWMQVAKQNMPISSIVIGVDLYPIKSIPGCIGIVADITTDKCRTLLSQELKTWKADVVLHDGAPNVGKNWLFDAYQQICLTLNSLKLATQFLRKGGWFVTKVFRSKDYNALLWVLKQLFRKVHATKPSASRKESAEIFVACQGYMAPDKIDPKLLDVKYVFEELDLDNKSHPSLLHPEKQKRIKAEGYTEQDIALRNDLSVTEFMQSTNGLAALQGISSITIDHDGVRTHPRTTREILECCKDIKVLGRKDLKGLLAWWKHIQADLFKKPEDADKQAPEEEAEPKKELTQDDIEDMEFEELEKHIAELAEGEHRDAKRKRKRAQKERTKLNERMNLKMVIKGDEGPREEEDEIFELRTISNEKDLNALQEATPDFVIEKQTLGDNYFPKFTRYDKDSTNHLDDDGRYGEGTDEEKSDSDSDYDKDGLGLSDEDEKKEVKRLKKKKLAEHPLIRSGDFRDKDTKRNQRAQLWFEKETLQKLNEDDDEDYDLDRIADEYKTKGVKILSENQRNEQTTPSEQSLGKKAKRRSRHPKDGSSSSDESSSSESEYEPDDQENGGTAKTMSKSEPQKKKIRLNEQELALGAMMIKGRKTKRDLIDMAWNRYTFSDSNLPAWFEQDEEEHMRLPVPVPKELADEYENKVRELNVRPIKKVMEAKARKKKRAVKRLNKAKKKAEQIMENADATAQEKTRQLRKLYKKAGEEKKKEISYVVSKKHLASKRPRRPAGLKGRYKVVDPRQKKEKRAAVAKERQKKKRGRK